MGIVEYSYSDLRGFIPYPSEDANKYSRGRAVVIGGSASYPGAVCLAGSAAQVMGAGYVEVFCAPESLQTVHLYKASLVARTWDLIGAKTFQADAGGSRKAYLVGSGMDGDSATESEIVSSALSRCIHPLVVDGSAITYLASDEGLSVADGRAQSLVITPHAGEAARLARAAGIDPLPDGENSGLYDDESYARYALDLAKAYRATVVLKGKNTFIAQDGLCDVAVMRYGSSALAKAGTGDVLAGFIVALLAQGMKALPAAVLGSSLHAISGNIASEKFTSICVAPEDVICNLAESIRFLEAFSS